MLAPPLKLLGGPGPPLPTPMFICMYVKLVNSDAKHSKM